MQFSLEAIGIFKVHRHLVAVEGQRPGLDFSTPQDPPFHRKGAFVDPASLGGIDPVKCELYWQRAKVWISLNSYYRVQLSSDSVIETYGPYAGRMELAYRIVKIPDGAGGARIRAAAECGNAFRCTPAVTDAIVAFKRFTSTGG